MARPSRRIALPPAVIATSGDRGSWTEGRLDPSDAFWRVVTADTTIVRTGHERVVSFAASIAPGRTLAHPTLDRISTSKRLLCVIALSPAPSRGPMAASVVAAAAGRFDWFARWLADLGAQSPADLARSDFLDFLTRLRRGGQPGLVDLNRRLAAIDDALLAAAVRIDADAPAAPLVLNPGALARLSGLTAAAVGTPAFRAALAARLGLPGPQANEAPVGAALIRDHLDYWRRLHEASIAGVLQDPLGFDPFTGRSRVSIAARLGVPGGRTPTIEPPRLLGLLIEATRFLLVEGPGIVAAVGATAPGCASEGDAPAPLRARVRKLMAACAILIGGLVARRRGEILGLRPGRVLQAAPGLGIVTFWIEKSLRRLDDVVAPPLVVEAVRTLEGLAVASGASGAAWLFEPSIHGRVTAFHPDDDMSHFAGFADGVVGDAPAMHELRRAHAILLGLGWALGSVDIVSRQLRHGDDGSTAIYVTEAEAGRMSAFADACRADRALSLAALDGAQRAELAADLERLRRGRELGMAADRARCEDAALLLLEEWASGGGDGPPGPNRAGQRTVRIGSQAGPRPADEPALLDQLLAAADAGPLGDPA